MKLCLIGSTKFKDQYLEYNKFLSLEGHVVYSVACFGNSGDTLSPEDKQVLDLVHLLKIQASDAVVLVTDATGYYGESTAREILWSKINDKQIYGLTPAGDLIMIFPEAKPKTH